MSTSTDHPIRTAIIGFGLGGRVFHAPLIDADPAYQLVAIVTGDPERAADAHVRHPEARVIADVDALFDELAAGSLELDLLVVTSPNDTHAPLAHRALDAGIDVVVDKPFAVTVADAVAITDHAERLGRRVTVFQNRRWDGDFRTVAALIESGDLGEVRQFESAFEWWKTEVKDRWKDVATPAEGGGILFDLGPHLIDQAVQLFGPVDVAGGGVHAELDIRRAGAVSDDDSFLTLHHLSGVRSRLWMSAVAPVNRPRFRVVGSAAVAETWGLDPQERQLIAGMGVADAGFGLDTEHPDAVVRTPDSAQTVALQSGDYAGYYRSLAEALLSGAPTPVDPRDSEHVLAIIAEAHRQAGFTAE